MSRGPPDISIFTPNNRDLIPSWGRVFLHVDHVKNVNHGVEALGPGLYLARHQPKSPHDFEYVED